MNQRIVISLAEGRMVRDVLTNGFLDMLTDAGRQITLLSPADRVPSFVQTWRRAGVEFEHLYTVNDSKSWLTRAMRFRKQLAHFRNHRILNVWLQIERQWLFPPCPEYKSLLRKLKPALVVATNATPIQESSLISTARQMGIATLAVVGSWDRLYKYMYTRAEHISVWSDLNKREAIEFEGYSPDHVHVTGPAQLDAYFSEEGKLSRTEFFRSLGLDPLRPLIVLATAGSFITNYDETYILDWLLTQVRQGAIPNHPQVICRLHPYSRLEYFQAYANNPDIRLSYMKGYIPTLGYTMTKEEVIEVGNMLRHADVVVTPGSTMTIEAAIFNTPVLVPIFHTYQSEIHEQYYKNRVFGRHFAHIRDENLVPILYGPEELLTAINRCFQEPEWYSEQRARLVQEYVGFTDGRSTARLAELTVAIAQ